MWVVVGVAGWVGGDVGGWVDYGDVGGGGVGVGGVVGGGVGCYNFPRSTNKIKSFDKILTSEKK